MDLDTFKPTFLIELEGKSLSKDITQKAQSFFFTDNERRMEELELHVLNRKRIAKRHLCIQHCCSGVLKARRNPCHPVPSKFFVSAPDSFPILPVCNR